MNLGNKILSLLRSHSVDEPELAKILGISPLRLNNYINDKFTPNINILSKIASFFSVDLYYFTDCGQNYLNDTVLVKLTEINEHSVVHSGKRMRLSKSFFKIDGECRALTINVDNPYFLKGSNLICVKAANLKNGDRLILPQSDLKLYTYMADGSEKLLFEAGKGPETFSEDKLSGYLKIQCVI